MNDDTVHFYTAIALHAFLQKGMDVHDAVDLAVHVGRLCHDRLRNELREDRERKAAQSVGSWSDNA